MKQTYARDGESSYRGRAMPRIPAIDPRRAQRTSSSPRTESASPASASTLSLPLILIGAVVLAGVVAMVVTSRDTPRPLDKPDPAVAEECVPIPLDTSITPVPKVGGVLRPNFEGGSGGISGNAGDSVVGDAALTIAFTGDALRGTSYASAAPAQTFSDLECEAGFQKPLAFMTVSPRLSDRGSLPASNCHSAFHLTPTQWMG